MSALFDWAGGNVCVVCLTAASFGGVILFAAAAAAQTTPANAPTFSKDIAPIFQAKCQECHQPNSIAPMSLITFAEARPWARSIKQRVVAAADAALAHRPERRRAEVQERHVALAKADRHHRRVGRCRRAAGRSEGPAAAPKKINADNEWKGVQDGFGPPDLVVRSSEYKMPAKGQDVWYRPMSELPITEPRWVKMVEIRPTNLKARKVVHHSIAYLVLSPTT